MSLYSVYISVCCSGRRNNCTYHCGLWIFFFLLFVVAVRKSTRQTDVHRPPSVFVCTQSNFVMKDLDITNASL